MALPLVVLGAGAFGGSHVAAEVAVAGAVAVVNFGLLAWFGSGFVQETASGQGGGLYGPLLVLKMALALPLFVGLMFTLAPLSVVVGLCAVILAVLFTGIELGRVGDDLPSTAPGAGLTPPGDPLES